MDSQRELGRVAGVSHILQHGAFIFLLLAGKLCNHHLKHGQREKFDNYSLMLLNKKACYLRWILTLSKIIISVWFRMETLMHERSNIFKSN